MQKLKTRRGRKRKTRLDYDAFSRLAFESATQRRPPPRKLRSASNQLGMFVFLMFDEQDPSKETTVIDISRRPPMAVTDYNLGNTPHRKSKKNTPRTWKLHTWCGPIFKKSTAESFKTLWSRSPRQLLQRALKGAQLAGTHDIDVYTYNTAELINALINDAKS